VHNTAPSERRPGHLQQDEDGSRAAPLATQQPLPADQLRIVATGAKTDGG
jgi:hypothetical protein